MTLSLAGGNSGGDPHPGNGSAGNTSCSNPWGEGHTQTIREGGKLLWPWQNKIIQNMTAQRCLGKWSQRGTSVCVFQGKGVYLISITQDLKMVHQISPFLPALAQYCMRSQTAATVMNL